MKKILVGYHGTAQANDALHLGAGLADAVDARLLVASALEFESLDGTRPLDRTVYTQNDHARYDRAKGAYFEGIFVRARAELGRVEFEPHPLQDSAAHGLIELAQTEEADLVVIGSTHHGPIHRVLAGTVATRLLRGAPCAVAVAPRAWRERRSSRVSLIGVGYDGSDESKVAVTRAEQLAEAFGAKLRVITIAPYIGVDAHLDNVWAERLREGAALVSGDVETERILREGRDASELALLGHGLDLLVVGSRGYGPLRGALAGSVSSELMRTAPCPVLVVPRRLGTPSDAELKTGAVDQLAP
jgi:nucleotide-binding universal stress UspA family protein